MEGISVKWVIKLRPTPEVKNTCKSNKMQVAIIQILRPPQPLAILQLFPNKLHFTLAQLDHMANRHSWAALLLNNSHQARENPRRTRMDLLEYHHLCFKDKKLTARMKSNLLGKLSTKHNRSPRRIRSYNKLQGKDTKHAPILVRGSKTCIQIRRGQLDLRPWFLRTTIERSSPCSNFSSALRGYHFLQNTKT